MKGSATGPGVANESVEMTTSMEEEKSDLGISYVAAATHVANDVVRTDVVVPAQSEHAVHSSGANEDVNIEATGGTDEGGEASRSSVRRGTPSEKATTSADGRAVVPEFPEDVAREVVPNKMPGAEARSCGNRCVDKAGAAPGRDTSIDKTGGRHGGGSTARASRAEENDDLAKKPEIAPAHHAPAQDHYTTEDEKKKAVGPGKASESVEVVPSDDRYPADWDEQEERLRTERGGENASLRLTNRQDATHDQPLEGNLALEPTSSAGDNEAVGQGEFHQAATVSVAGMGSTVEPLAEEEENVGGAAAGGLQAEVDVVGSTFALPTATYVVDDIVQADVVDPEANMPSNDLQEEKRLKWYQRWPYLLVIIGFVIVGAVLITLGATGIFDSGGQAVVDRPQNKTSANESCPVPHSVVPRSPLRFCRDTTCWVQIGSDLEGTEPGDRFGKYVSFANDGTRFVVSAGDEDTLGDNAGTVAVYDIGNNGSFIQVGQTIRGPAPEDEIRGALSLDGNRLALGAPYYSGDDGKKDRAGQVRIYELQSGNWSLLGTPLDGDSKRDRFGYSVALNRNGSIVAVGATFHDERRGEVRVFRYENRTRNGTWVLLGDHINSDADFQEKSGWDVKLSDTGTIVAVGAKNDDETEVSPGRIRVFQYSSGNWSQVGNDLMGENGGDDYGRFIAMSSDGRTVAGGAWRHDGANGTMVESGHARVYEYNEMSLLWSQIGRDLDGDGSEDRLQKVSLSASGKRVAIFTGSQGVNSTPGYVRVYDLVDEDWQQVGGRLSGQSYDGNFGSHAALSAAGDRLIVGGPDPNDDPCYKGLVRIFHQQEV